METLEDEFLEELLGTIPIQPIPEDQHFLSGSSQETNQLSNNLLGTDPKINEFNFPLCFGGEIKMW